MSDRTTREKADIKFWMSFDIALNVSYELKQT